MPRLARALLVLALTIAGLSACHQTSNVARCDNLLDKQEETIGQMGAWLRCDPSYDADEQSNCPPTYRCQSVMEWDLRNPNDGTRIPVAWLWQANLSDYWLKVNAYEMQYEVYQYKVGNVPSYYLDVQRDSVPASMQQAAFSWAVQQAA